MRSFIGAFALAALIGAGPTRAETSAPTRPAAAAPAPVEVMVLGVWHFSNPGADLNNVNADDVLAPRRQAELEEVAARLARFAPTRIAVEIEAKAPDFALPAYAAFTRATLTKDRGEDVQIGYRLARRLAHAAVYGLDERGGPGEPDYFPFDKVSAYAGKHGRAEWLKGLHVPIRTWLTEFERRQPVSTMAELLHATNDPVADLELHRGGYYELLRLGDAAEQPGAELNAYWYMRNAKIFSKVAQATEPGDRVLLIFGAGHSYWLKHFARTTPGFVLVDAQPYLIPAPSPARR
jgi:hypothetical protein